MGFLQTRKDFLAHRRFRLKSPVDIRTDHREAEGSHKVDRGLRPHLEAERVDRGLRPHREVDWGLRTDHREAESQYASSQTWRNDMNPSALRTFIYVQANASESLVISRKTHAN
jgi:hypothetical protein